MRLGEKFIVLCAYQHGGNLLENIDGLGRRGVFVWLIGLGHGEVLIWMTVVESFRERLCGLEFVWIPTWGGMDSGARRADGGQL